MIENQELMLLGTTGLWAYGVASSESSSVIYFVD